MHVISILHLNVGLLLKDIFCILYLKYEEKSKSYYNFKYFVSNIPCIIL